MSPRKKDKKASSPVKGSGPEGKVELDDIRAKLGEIRGDLDQVTEDAKPYLMYAAVGGAVALVVIAFLAGKRMGRRKATWVEIKRL
jgi:hypothetical protein